MGRTVRGVVEECGVEDTHAVVPALLAQVPHRTARLQALAALAHLSDLLCRESAVKHGVPVPQEPLRGRASSWPLCGRADARGQSARAEGRGQKQRHHARSAVVRAEARSDFRANRARRGAREAPFVLVIVEGGTGTQLSRPSLHRPKHTPARPALSPTTHRTCPRQRCCSPGAS